MSDTNLTWIANFIWGIADDVLRDVYVRGKYRDVILPMTVIRRLDALLEPTKKAVVEMKDRLDQAGVTNQDPALRQAAGQSFYNTSPFTLRDLKARARQQQLKADFEAYLDGFSPNVQEILDKFKFRNQIPTLVEADILGYMIEKFLDSSINLSPNPLLTNDGSERLPGLDNHAMGTIFEELIRRFNEENNEEAGEHFTPRDVIKLMADLLLKGEGEEAENFRHGSTLSQDGFPSREFDFMLSNPPYGKSWKTDLERMGGKTEITDPRFVIEHGGDPEFKLLTRSSDGQLLFLVNKLAKMKHKTPLGSRIAEVHNGSSLFTGDAGQGESNIRRWIIENDWLEAIVALPLNMFYNTGIATYIWVLSNRKPENRKGKVQLIDASSWYKPLRKNLGKKNCELPEDDISRIMDAFQGFTETEQSKIFPNEAFGYWKITVERPLRLKIDLSDVQRVRFRKACKEMDDEPLANLVDRLAVSLGIGPHLNFNVFIAAVETDADKHGVKLTAKRVKLLQSTLAVKDEEAEPVIKKIYKPGKSEVEPLRGRYAVTLAGKASIVEYEPDSELRDTEQVPLLEDGGIDAFFRREVLPHVPDAWIDGDATKIGYEISFTRYFYKPQPLRTLAEIRTDIEALERETEGLLKEIIGL